MRRHRLDPFSLLFGALFVGVGCSFLLGSTIGDAKLAVWPLFAMIVGGTFVAWAIATVVRERRPVAEAAEVADPADVAEVTVPAEAADGEELDRPD